MTDVALDVNDARMVRTLTKSVIETKAIAIVGGGYSGLMAIESSRSSVSNRAR